RSSHRRRGACVTPTMACTRMRALWPRLFWPVVALVVVTVAALLFRNALILGFRRWTGQRATGDSLVLQAIRLPSLLWCVVLGLFVAIEMAELPPRLAVQIHAVLEAEIILSVTMTVAGALDSLVAAASERRALAVGVTGLFRTSVRLVVLVVGGLVLLSSLGIAVTPILTALGVGGLAVALALQDTLSHLFAGIHLLVDEATRAVGQVDGLLAEPPPSARLIPGFGDYALEFTLACQVRSFVDQFSVQHELRKRVLKRLRAERIRIPLPTEVRPREPERA